MLSEGQENGGDCAVQGAIKWGSVLIGLLFLQMGPVFPLPSGILPKKLM